MREEIQLLLDRVKLPPLSFDLLQQLGDVNCDLDTVAESISLDPSLTANLLRICNNAVFGAAEPVSTVAEAINRAGFKSVYMLAAALYGNSCFTGSSTMRLDAQRLWRHSVTTAFNTRFVAESTGLDANTLFTAGLLHDIGKVVLAQVRSGADCNFYEPADPLSLRQETEIFGVTHAEAGAALLEKWKLPRQLVHAVRYHHQPAGSMEFQKFVAGVAVGNAVSHTPGHPDITAREEYANAFCLLGLELGHLQSWREQFNTSHDLITQLTDFRN